MTGRIHSYLAQLEWRGNRGAGTASYDGYGREFDARIDGKPGLEGSADPVFRGDPTRYNPEELLLVALASCHMLSYLALCAREGLVVTSYLDHPEGTLQLDARGGGRFNGVMLHPSVTVSHAAQLQRAKELHVMAHSACYIASSCNFPVEHRATIRDNSGTVSVSTSERPT